MPNAPTTCDYDALMIPSNNKIQLKMCKLRLYSSGAFSNVYRGTLVEPKPEREIAVKKTWPDKDQSAHKNYEIFMLRELSKEKHINIVQLLFTFSTVSPDGRICESMVFDFMLSTLHCHIRHLGGAHPNIIDIKIYTWQLFNGLYYLYKKRICHRDIKPQNILIDAEPGILKIGDFGSSKFMKEGATSTPYQVTRFYRPLELLFDALVYTPLVDVWSAGCVFGEMLRGDVLFPGEDTNDQLKLIVDTLGLPDAKEYKAMNAITKWKQPKKSPLGYADILPQCPPESLELLQRILVYVPTKRLHGPELLNDPYFNELLMPSKKRLNGRFVSDIPAFKEMVDFGPKQQNRSVSKKKMKTSKSDSTLTDSSVLKKLPSNVK